VLPAQPERFTLPQAKGETYRPASSIGPQRCLVEDHSHLMQRECLFFRVPADGASTRTSGLRVTLPRFTAVA
jgi:hypothetical protein